MSKFPFSRSYEVIRDDRNGDYKNFSGIKQSLETYANKLKKNIRLLMPHGNQSSVSVTEGELQIKFWASPIDNRHSVLESAYGFDLESGQRDAFPASGTLTAIYDEDNCAIAEFVVGNIYVLFDLPHGPNSVTLIEHIMEDYLVYLKAVKDNKLPEFIQMIENRRVQSEMKNLQRICRINTDYGRSDAKDNLPELSDEIARTRESLITLERRRTEYLRILNPSFKQQINEEDVTKLHDRLVKLSLTGRIEVTRNTITIPIGQVDVTYEDTVYDIGEFDIVIYTDGEEGGLRCVNKTRKIGSYYHPHVDDDGDTCLGNITDNIGILIGQMKYDIVVQIMMDFLTQVNDNDWMCNVTNWPVKGQGDDREDEGEDEDDE